MFNIADFSSNLNKFGTIQTNKFLIEIPAPRILGPSRLDEVILYRASSARIPGVTFDFQRVFRYGIGPEQKIPTNVHVTDISINFVDTVKNDIWKRFAVWFNGIFDFTGRSGGSQASYKTEYKDYYVTDVRIYLFDNEAILRNVVVLKDAFPTNLGDVNVSWSDNNKLYEFTVGFAFKEWYYDGYALQEFQSGASLGAAQTAQVQPNRTESPRPGPTVRPETYGPPVPQINPNRSQGGPLLSPGQGQGLRTEQANRNRASGFYTPEQQAEINRLLQQ